MAGTLEHRVSTSVRTNAGTVSSASYTLTGDHEFNYEVKAKSIGTDTQIDMACDASTIVSVVMQASSDTLLETNANDAAGGDAITILASKPIVWNTQIEDTLGTPCPITTDVTTAFVTNAAASDLSIYILMSGA